MDYIPVSEQEKNEMLERIGVKNAGELYFSVPQKSRINALKLPEGITELELQKRMSLLGEANLYSSGGRCFCGAGAYEHFVPALVTEITGRSEFSTAYTPYQPEASQGILQSIFEYQSMITELTGLDVSNASLYDGASATAEAALLALRTNQRKKLVISKTVHPEYRQVIKTYLQGANIQITEAPYDSAGATSKDAIKELVDKETAALIVQSPNFFGTIEDLAGIKNLLNESGALFVNIVNPVSLGTLMPPGEAGADIAVGEGQVLGNSLGFGGCTFGFMACKKAFAWKMPGRIVGQTTDTAGRRGFVLTLQAREQHIRRERATSNICTNAALNALAGCVYLSGWGPEGLKTLGEANINNSHYAYNEIIKIPGFEPAFQGQVFFNEFALKTTKNTKDLAKLFLDENIIGPLDLERFYPEIKNTLLFCVTETKSKEEIDKFVRILRHS